MNNRGFFIINIIICYRILTEEDNVIWKTLDSFLTEYASQVKDHSNKNSKGTAATLCLLYSVIFMY